MKQRWIPGNRFQLLINGEAFFPRVFAAIESAREHVHVQTFILFEDVVGMTLHGILMAAARRGVRVDLLVDGWGSPDLSHGFVESLTAAGVTVHVFDPSPRLFGMRTNPVRRMHRKLCVVDGRTAFVGGINFAADHLIETGPEAKQDYAVEVQGPIVGVIERFVRESLQPRPRMAWLRRAPAVPPAALPPPVGESDAMFVTRDNHEHRSDIERLYRLAIRAARQRVVIANAYFFPGYLLIREIRRAAKRGVDVRLVLQGMPDMPIVKFAASALYHYLVSAGVRIFEYCERPLHGKVALADDEWSTVGSSNLDPFSLTLNLEANVVIRDRRFNGELHAHLEELMSRTCRPVLREELIESRAWRLLRGFFLLRLLRLYPVWLRLLPPHMPRILRRRPARPPQAPAAERK